MKKKPKKSTRSYRCCRSCKFTDIGWNAVMSIFEGRYRYSKITPELHVKISRLHTCFGIFDTLVPLTRWQFLCNSIDTWVACIKRLHSAPNASIMLKCSSALKYCKNNSCRIIWRRLTTLQSHVSWPECWAKNIKQVSRHTGTSITGQLTYWN